MPHERIYSTDQDPDHTNNVQVAWGHPSSPSNTGPGHGNGDGHVMIVVERPGTPARTGSSVEEIKRQLFARIESLASPEIVAAFGDGRDQLAEVINYLIGPENLSYAFGAPLERLAVAVDRKGCNDLISAVRRGRNAAFGRDE